MVIISIITLMVMSLMMTIDDDYQDNYEDDDMDGCDYQNYRFKISLRQGLYWICPSWGFDSRSASLFKVQILRAKVKKNEPINIGPSLRGVSRSALELPAGPSSILELPDGS